MRSSWRCTRRFLPVILMITFLSWSPHAQAVDVNERAPDFTVQDLEGDVYDLDDMNDAVVLLFFFSPKNPFCVTHASQLEEDIWKQFSWHNFHILGMNMGAQEVEIVEAFRMATGVAFPLVVEGAPVAEDYGVEENTYVVVDGRGMVYYVSTGTDAQGYNEDELRSAVSGALQGVLPPKESTWGRIKTLFEERFRRAGRVD